MVWGKVDIFIVPLINEKEKTFILLSLHGLLCLYTSRGNFTTGMTGYICIVLD